MWYVNFKVNKFVQTDYIRFYINYVVCKYALQILYFLLKKSFILTMWYVNGSFSVTLSIKSSSFILTMWYVNSFSWVNTLLNVSCFILTMWYANYNHLNQLRIYPNLK